MSVKIERFPMPGEPPFAYKKWYFSTNDFDPDKIEVDSWKIRSARELAGKGFRRYDDKDLERYVDSVTPKEALAKYIGIPPVELEYHYFN